MTRKNTIQTPEQEPLQLSELENLTDAKLEEFLRNLVDDMARQIAQMVLVVRELIRRDIDLRPFYKEMPIVRRVMEVANNRLSSKAFAAFYEDNPLLVCLGSLPIKDQEKLVDVGTVKVYSAEKAASSKSTDHYIVDLADMSKEEKEMVFDKAGAKVRSVEEQARWAKLNIVSVRVKKRKGKIRFDEDTKMISCDCTPIEEMRDFMKKFDRR